MKVFSQIIKTLSIPDDQRYKWYEWSTNQGFHALLGVIVALYFPSAALQMAAIIALLKELGDLMRGGKLVDSLVDTTFWVLGAWLITASNHNIPVILLAFALVCGVVPRIRKRSKTV